jgi:hypothetical protein
MTRFVRPRTLIYAAILLLIGSGTLIGLSARAAVDVNVLHDRNPLFVMLSDGRVRNGYTVKVPTRAAIPRPTSSRSPASRAPRSRWSARRRRARPSWPHVPTR